MGMQTGICKKFKDIDEIMVCESLKNEGKAFIFQMFKIIFNISFSQNLTNNNNNNIQNFPSLDNAIVSKSIKSKSYSNKFYV